MAQEFRRAALILPDMEVRSEFADLLREAMPGLELTVMAPLTNADPPDVAAEFDALFTFGQYIDDEGLAGAKRLRWIQGLGTGVDGLIDRTTLGPDVWITSARGVHSACVSEAALALMMAVSRDIPKLVRAQQARQWTMAPAQLLTGRTVGILGVGLIAEALARRCKALDLTVEGVTARREAACFDRLWPYAALETAVAGFDYFVLLAPLSHQTREIVNARVLAAMKQDAFLINVARGGLVDEPAMIEALERGQLRGAGLDVFAVEPLPPESPLWSMPNVLISPHAAGYHRDYPRDVVPIVRTNFEAFRTGRVGGLLNVVRRPIS